VNVPEYAAEMTVIGESRMFTLISQLPEDTLEEKRS
jgi:hypothetical protein